MNIYQFFERRKSIHLFAVITIFTLILAFLIQHFVLIKNVYYQDLGSQMSLEQIDRLLDAQNKYQYLGYIIIVLFNLVKYSLIALVIQMGVYLWGGAARFGQIFKVVVISEFVFIIPLIIKLIFFYFFKINYSLQDVQSFYPLSFLNFFPGHSVSNLWLYPLQLLNVFEVVYWFVLAYGISKLLGRNVDRSLKIVVSSYIPALVIWVVFLMFLTVAFNPA